MAADLRDRGRACACHPERHEQRSKRHRRSDAAQDGQRHHDPHDPSAERDRLDVAPPRRPPDDARKAENRGGGPDHAGVNQKETESNREPRRADWMEREMEHVERRVRDDLLQEPLVC